MVQASTAREPGDLDWAPAEPPVEATLAPTAQPDGTIVWQGSLRLPEARLGTELRLVVTEHESHEGGGRLVYVDAVRL